MHALAPVPGGPESLRVVWNSSSSTGGRARCVRKRPARHRLSR